MNKKKKKEYRLRYIGIYAKGIRERLGYTQRKAAKKLEVSQTLISLFENGKTDSAYLLFGYENIL